MLVHDVDPPNLVSLHKGVSITPILDFSSTTVSTKEGLWNFLLHKVRTGSETTNGRQERQDTKYLRSEVEARGHRTPQEGRIATETEKKRIFRWSMT